MEVMGRHDASFDIIGGTYGCGNDTCFLLFSVFLCIYCISYCSPSGQARDTENLQYSTQETASTSPLRLEYAMNHKRRGKAVIINNKAFDYKKTRRGSRKESDVDAASLYTVFKSRRFDVKLCNNQTVAAMEKIFIECKHYYFVWFYHFHSYKHVCKSNKKIHYLKSYEIFGRHNENKSNQYKSVYCYTVQLNLTQHTKSYNITSFEKHTHISNIIIIV